MNDCYLSLLLNFRALLSIDSGANLVNSKQAIGVILPDLSLLGYAVPVESFGIGLFIVLFAYLAVEYNVQLLSHEKLKIAMNMLHRVLYPEQKYSASQNVQIRSFAFLPVFPFRCRAHRILFSDGILVHIPG